MRREKNRRRMAQIERGRNEKAKRGKEGEEIK